MRTRDTETRRRLLVACGLALALALSGCGGGDGGEGHGGRGGGPGGERSGRGGGRGGPGGPGGFPGGGGAGAVAAVPVEAQAVVRRSISSYIETNGTLEAEREVDIVARYAGPIVELAAEESQAVAKGQVLARIDADELQAQREVIRVELDEARIAYERAERLRGAELVSEVEYETAKARYDTAKAQLDSNAIQLSYTEIRAPFDGLIVERYVKFAENVGVNAPLFRISDFDPLLCPIQVPERELSLLRAGQPAHLTVEAWPGERFSARVLRLSPVIDPATGTIKVTLQVNGRQKLRPGMFASVFLETATRDNVPVIPKSALTLDSIGDTVFVVDGETASRRPVELGFNEGDFVEVTSGVSEGELVIVLGQDGLSDGTPIQVLTADGAPRGRRQDGMRDGGPGRPTGDGGEGATPAGRTEGQAAAAGPGGEREGRGGRRGERGGGPGGRPDFANMTDEQLEAIKERMRQRGMTDEQIEERLKRMRERAQAAGQ